MDVWEIILIVLGSVVAGFLLGLMLVHVFRWISRMQSSFFQKKEDFVRTEAPRVSNSGITRTNSQQEDSLEMSVQKHKNTATAVSQKQSTQTKIAMGPEDTNQKNTPIVINQMQSPKMDVSKEGTNISQKSKASKF